MSRSKLIRQAHRWLSIAFTLSVIGNIVALAAQKESVWVGFLALLPLALLLFTGLYLFVLPYVTRSRAGEARTEPAAGGTKP